MRGRWAVAVTWALLAACASPVPVGSVGATVDAPSIASACARFAAALDDDIDRSGVRDAQDARLAATPWLRVDRFEASFAGEPLGAAAIATWLERLRARDAAARRAELANLPPAELQGPATDAARRIRAGPPALEARAAIAAAVDRCGHEAVASLRADPAALAALRGQARVPDDYVDWQRALGLYPLAALPFAAGVRREEAAIAAAFSTRADRVARSARIVAPAIAAQMRPVTDVPASRPALDALGVPRVDDALRDRLLALHAPVFALAGHGPDDRFGELVLGGGNEGPRASVDVSRPAVYGRLEFTRWQGAVRMQLVYTAWFPRRAPLGPLDLLAGHLDGVVLRLTLDGTGRIAMIDSIHACGCWHLFVPVGPIGVRPAPSSLQEWAFVPARLAAVPAGHRVRVRLAARTHALEGIDTVPDAPSASASPDGPASYRLLDEASLRSLPGPDGVRRSLYDPRGRVPGTERAERWLFWPMGIADAGATRQWGRHATAFIGRRHFDDADLLERRFDASGAAAGGTPD